jgi:hypothetical protein
MMPWYRSMPYVLSLVSSAFLWNCVASEDTTESLDSDPTENFVSDPASGAIPDPDSDSAPEADLVSELASADGEVSMKDMVSPTGTDAGPPCTFGTQGEIVRMGAFPHEVVGYGSWINVDCPVRSATVTVQLQEYRDGRWRNVGTVGKRTVGSGGRALARARCNSQSSTRWRSVIDVDLVDLQDPPNKLVTSARTLPCRR